MSGFPGAFNVYVPSPNPNPKSEKGIKVPYEVKHTGDGKCQVVSKDTGKVHSNEPIPCARAYRQMKALYVAMKRNGESMTGGSTTGDIKK